MDTHKEVEYIVLGCGGIGLATLYWLSRTAGKEVLGLEQYSLGHNFGASQDHSRIIRLAYDDPDYARLTPYAFVAWQEVEEESGIQLVFKTGGLILAPKDPPPPSEIENYVSAMQQAGIPFEKLNAEETMRRYPQFHLKPDDQVLYQANAGLVDPRKANAVHATLARARGATILENTAVQSIRPTSNGIELVTTAGKYFCRKLVVATSAWTNQVLSGLGIHLPLTVTEEQVTYFATPHLKMFSLGRFPVWIWHGEDCYYGFPVYGEVATKAGQDVGGDVITVETRRLEPNPRPLMKLQAFLKERIPDFLGPILYTKPCLYTMPPDRGFIVDTLPDYPQIGMAVGAGHAFKFACLIGRILSELAIDDKTVYPISALSLRRPAIVDPNFQSLLRLAG